MSGAVLFHEDSVSGLGQVSLDWSSQLVELSGILKISCNVVSVILQYCFQLLLSVNIVMQSYFIGFSCWFVTIN